VVALATMIDADLVVMPTHGHDAVLDAVRGSTTERVTRRLGRPLLSVPLPT
jgi:nucleotide-binding universal stress UspA family protein